MSRVKPAVVPPNKRADTFQRSSKPSNMPDRMTWQKMQLRRLGRLLRPSIFAVVLLILIVLGTGMARIASHGGTVRQALAETAAEIGFRVEQIDLPPNSKTPYASILKALGVQKGDPILAVSLPDAKAKLEKIAWIRAATVERVLPDKLRIVLDERRPFAVWQNHGNFTLVDEFGNVVSDTDIAAFVPVLPLVVGEGAPADAARLIGFYNHFAPLNGRMLAAIRVGGRRWDLCMTSGAIVQLPEGAEEPALGKLAELQQSKALLDRPLAEIDLRLPDKLRLTPMTGPPCGHAPASSDQDGGKAAQPARRPA
jgi:cell division protein FtsQ